MAALQQMHVSLEEAAENLGASQRRTIRRIVVPLMAGGILAGFVTSFVTAAVELSATILLVSRESLAPMSYGIYLYMQSHRRPRARRRARRHRRGAGRARHLVLASLSSRARAPASMSPENRDMTPVGVEIRNVALAFGATQVLRDITLAVEPGEFFALLGPSGSRQVHAAAAHRRLQPRTRPGTVLIGGARRHRRAAVEAQRRHGVPELRAVAAHDGRAERRLRARGAQAAARRDPRARSPPRSSWWASPGFGDAPSRPALRRPAAARGARAHARDRAAGAAARRAAVQPRRQAARADARTSCGAAAAARHHDDLRHPRPGRGDDRSATASR